MIKVYCIGERNRVEARYHFKKYRGFIQLYCLRERDRLREGAIAQVLVSNKLL
ncbi:MAG: hypothetical protein RI580_12325 [Halothece sp. Uz-M2-17]|nr:hypothetical protein [Halothece sp. Uz-M2-17]